MKNFILLFVLGVFFYLEMQTLLAVIDSQRDLISILCLEGVCVSWLINLDSCFNCCYVEEFGWMIECLREVLQLLRVAGFPLSIACHDCRVARNQHQQSQGRVIQKMFCCVYSLICRMFDDKLHSGRVTGLNTSEYYLPRRERGGGKTVTFRTFWMASVNPSHKYQVSSSLYFRCLKSGRSCPVGSNYHDNWGSCGSLGLEVPSSGWLLPRKWRGNFVTSHHLNVYDWNRNAKCILLHFWPFARLNSKMFRVL